MAKVEIMVQIKENAEEVFRCSPTCTLESVKDCVNGFAASWHDYPGYMGTFALDYDTGEVLFEATFNYLFRDNETGKKFYVCAANKRLAYKIAKIYFDLPLLLDVHSDELMRMCKFEKYSA